MWVVSVHWKGLLWSLLWANPASLPFQPTQREQRGGGKLHTNLLTIPILISEPSCNQLTPKHTTTRPSYLLLFFTLTCYFSFPLLWKPVCLHAVCSKLILFSVIKNDVVTSPAQWAFSRHLCYYQLFSVHVKRGETTLTLLTCGWAARLSGWSWFPPGSVEGPEHSAPSFSSGTLGLQGVHTREWS